MMKRYEVYNDTSGLSLGEWNAESPQAAIAAMMLDAGCDDAPSPDVKAREAESRSCECGEWDGCYACDWTGDPDDRVLVEFIEPNHRASHVVHGNRGVYPHNRAARIWVSPECAARMLRLDGDWCQRVDA